MKHINESTYVTILNHVKVLGPNNFFVLIRSIEDALPNFCEYYAYLFISCEATWLLKALLDLKSLEQYLHLYVNPSWAIMCSL